MTTTSTSNFQKGELNPDGSNTRKQEIERRLFLNKDDCIYSGHAIYALNSSCLKLPENCVPVKLVEEHLRESMCEAENQESVKLFK